MCNPASFVLTKDRVFWSKQSNSHEDIIEENGLSADGARGLNILRVEIVPLDFNYSLPIKQWRYKIDQDILPTWANSEEDEKRTRLALKQWKKFHCVTQTSGDNSTQTSGEGSVQITRWFDNGTKVATRIIDSATANKWYYVSAGVWRKCTLEEAKIAESMTT